MSYDIGEYEYTYPAAKPLKSLGTQLKEAQESIAKIECGETGHWSIKNNIITCLKPVEGSDGNE